MSSTANDAQRLQNSLRPPASQSTTVPLEFCVFSLFLLVDAASRSGVSADRSQRRGRIVSLPVVESGSRREVGLDALITHYSSQIFLKSIGRRCV